MGRPARFRTGLSARAAGRRWHAKAGGRRAFRVDGAGRGQWRRRGSAGRHPCADGRSRARCTRVAASRRFPGLVAGQWPKRVAAEVRGATRSGVLARHVSRRQGDYAGAGKNLERNLSRLSARVLRCRRQRAGQPAQGRFDPSCAIRPCPSRGRAAHAAAPGYRGNHLCESPRGGVVPVAGRQGRQRPLSDAGAA